MRLALWTFSSALVLAVAIWALLGPPEADATSVLPVVARLR
jgi:hypothetical protein